MDRRSALVGAATALALIGSACASGEDGDTSPTVTAAPGPSTSAVLTADAIPILRTTAVVPAGTEATAALDAGLIEPTTVTRADFPPDGVVTVELIEGRTASADIPAGTLLTLSMFRPG